MDGNTKEREKAPERRRQADARPRVLVIATGGTISSVGGVGESPVPTLTGSGILERIPATSVQARLEVEEYSRALSSQLTVEQVAGLAQRIRGALADDPGLAGVVVLHGTGAMEESAFLADIVVEDERPVVFTGAMVESSSPFSDGPRNAADAVRVAVDPASHGRGVLVVMNQQVHLAREVQKMHTTALDTFASEFGPVGRVYPHAVVYERASRRAGSPLGETLESSVELVKFVVGMEGRIVDVLVEMGVRGLVLEGSGIGNVNASVAAAVREAVARGVVVVVTSRCAYGRVYPHYGGGSGARALQAMGCVLTSLPGTKARLALMHAMGSLEDVGRIQRWFDAWEDGDPDVGI